MQCMFREKKPETHAISTNLHSPLFIYVPIPFQESQPCLLHVSTIFHFDFGFYYIYFWCLTATFNNISAISWRPLSVVEEVGVPGENHRPWASNW